MLFIIVFKNRLGSKPKLKLYLITLCFILFEFPRDVNFWFPLINDES